MFNNNNKMLVLPITSICWYWHSWLQWHYFILAKDLYRTSVLPLTLSSFWNNLIILFQDSDIRAFANYSWDLTVFTANGIISRSWFVPIYIFLVTSSNYIFIQTRVSTGYSCNVWVQVYVVYIVVCLFLLFLDQQNYQT